MNKNNIKELTLSGLLIAIVCVATMSVQIPMPLTSGYIHLGDSVILIAAYFFGKKHGAIAGGIGSMLADIISGYGHWAPFTLIIKALMGYVSGSIYGEYNEADGFFKTRTFIGSLAGAVLMVAGYLAGGTLLKGSFAVALTSVPGNMVQGAMGAVLFFVIGKAMDKAHVAKVISREN